MLGFNVHVLEGDPEKVVEITLNTQYYVIIEKKTSEVIFQGMGG